jgi:regulator of protease activity HflC (stomatin/prohibitin superfamily)
MAAEGETPDPGSVDRVINQVLVAEREARSAVGRCRAEAARLLAEAEERSRRIVQWTERRIKLAHRIADHGVERALGELRGQGSGSGSLIPMGDSREVLARAVDDLVDEILAGPP